MLIKSRCCFFIKPLFADCVSLLCLQRTVCFGGFICSIAPDALLNLSPHSPNPTSNSENVFLRARAVSYFSFETVNGEQGASGEALENGEERALRRSFNN